MKYFGRFTSLLLILVACVLVVLFLSADPKSGVTLAELDGPSNAGSPGAGFPFGNTLEGGSVYLAASGLEPIFYGVLAICGIVLAVRVVIAVLISAREQRPLAREKSGRRRPEEPELTEVRDGVPDVVVPLIRPKILKAETAPVVVPAESTPARTLRLRDQVPRSARGPVARMMFAFAGIVAAFGMLATALVYFRLSSALLEHALQRATVTAVNVSDGASPYLFKNNAAGLRELLRKHANRPELAYIVVEDRAQRIFAHSFAVLPAELSEEAKIGPTAGGHRRTLRVGGNAVYEVTVPMMEGRVGAVRVGIWRERVDNEISETLKPLIAWLAFVAVGGIIAAVFFAWRINRPIFRLVSAAQAISRGDLDMPSPNVGDRGEFGELSRALERLRSSMKAALIRLGR